MIGSGLILYYFMIPLISRGENAVLIVTLTSGMIAFVSLVFVIGPSRKTFSAVLGTMGGILVAGLIVMFAQNYLRFSGLEHAISADIMEATRTPPFDFRQVLLAGMLMGVLPWKNRERERRSLLVRYSPKYLHYAGGYYDVTFPEWADELTEAQRALLEPPYIYNRPLLEEDGETVVRPRVEY